MFFLLFFSFSYLIFFWGFLAYIIYRKKDIGSSFNEELGISVVIAAKNEQNNISSNLQAWLNLDYTNYQIILVINNTTDDSYLITQNFKNQKFKVINLEKTPTDWAPKKFALTQGVLNADYEYIVFTDADCKPISSQWLKYYNAAFQKGNEIVIGLSPYKKNHSFINGFIQWETFQTAFLYSVFAILQKPYMCVGRNWGLKKEVFFKEKGFEKHHKILSGDDDLFIQNLENQYSIEVLLNPDSQTVSNPAIHLKEYWRQKKRHFSASKHYQLKTKIFLFIHNFLQLISFFGIIHTNFLLKNQILLLLLCLMNLIKFSAIQVFTQRTHFKVPFLYKIVGEYLLFLFQVAVLPYSLFKKNHLWK